MKSDVVYRSASASGVDAIARLRGTCAGRQHREATGGGEPVVSLRYAWPDPSVLLTDSIAVGPKALGGK